MYIETCISCIIYMCVDICKTVIFKLILFGEKYKYKPKTV